MLLLRHASAGEKLGSPSLDRVRPLDAAGRAAARDLPAALAGFAIARILTSSHRRCLESVRQLAEARGLPVERREELAPDASLGDTKALLEELPVCTHREVIERLFDGDIECEKGGAWVVERRGSRLVPATYLAPPAAAPRRGYAVAGINRRIS